ncbi:uncharacterized protein LOC129758211 isoform X1 [Uranotaenia lowii]|uniref:uncharacterized protein LOC129758211 isoform X1 n=1 Tax=Uranotaenia lowii TaxID=190385 RepID=UPI0024785852|nr:uncharacterized protein LOC129758211 isoform X1 [Uranotaenia lowii]
MRAMFAKKQFCFIFSVQSTGPFWDIWDGAFPRFRQLSGEFPPIGGNGSGKQAVGKVWRIWRLPVHHVVQEICHHVPLAAGRSELLSKLIEKPSAASVVVMSELKPRELDLKIKTTSGVARIGLF